MTPSPTQDQVQQQLVAFLEEVLPAGVEVVAAQVNRVPEVSGPSFVVVTPVRFSRLRTNVDSGADAAFTGSIAGAVMTIAAVDARFPNGKISVGSTIFGSGVPSGTKVLTILTGSGQVGTYGISTTAALSSRTLSAGALLVQQAQKVSFQLDFHGDPAADTSGDMAATVATLFRDGYAVQQFANQSPNYGVVPLYADDPAQRPFFNDQQQVETRWVVEALLQANVVLSVPQQFADSVGLSVVDVDAAYPP